MEAVRDLSTVDPGGVHDGQRYDLTEGLGWLGLSRRAHRTGAGVPGDHAHRPWRARDRDVTITDHRPTPTMLKVAAIAAGVPIQPDFVLSWMLPNGQQKILAEDKPFPVKDGDVFWAIPGDDNS